MGALSKLLMTEALCDDLGLSKPDAKSLVDAFFEEIKETLASGQPVKLSGFGNFKLIDKPARPGRNPKTGKAAMIAARRVVTFKAGLMFKKKFKSTKTDAT
ncbi:MAG: integration host factor subunit alpha [Gammaproteobacteria bacterium]|nr:integration host factor subunit alpha [Gammaproteobacteria bacterium]